MEIIVAMAFLSGICAMIVSSIIKGNKDHKDDY